jgi:hypothetical protein
VDDQPAPDKLESVVKEFFFVYASHVDGSPDLWGGTVYARAAERWRCLVRGGDGVETCHADRGIESADLEDVSAKIQAGLDE